MCSEQVYKYTYFKVHSLHAVVKFILLRLRGIYTCMLNIHDFRPPPLSVQTRCLKHHKVFHPWVRFWVNQGVSSIDVFRDFVKMIYR